MPYKIPAAAGAIKFDNEFITVTAELAGISLSCGTSAGTFVCCYFIDISKTINNPVCVQRHAASLPAAVRRTINYALIMIVRLIRV
ncbi:MAG: hypothetical protein FWD13_01700 [Treponema sp.]|nr:hypothetical protein [Treponema sp.]